MADQHFDVKKKNITKCKHVLKELLLEIELKSDKIG